MHLLGKKKEVAIKWFEENNIVVNLKNFQAIIINRQNKSNNNIVLKISNTEITTKTFVTLLGIEIDDKLNESYY